MKPTQYREEAQAIREEAAALNDEHLQSILLMVAERYDALAATTVLKGRPLLGELCKQNWR